MRCVAACCNVFSVDVADGICWCPKCYFEVGALQCVSMSGAVCCSVLQCVAVCCSVLQCVAVCCSVLQCDSVDVSGVSSK